MTSGLPLVIFFIKNSGRMNTQKPMAWKEYLE